MYFLICEGILIEKAIENCAKKYQMLTNNGQKMAVYSFTCFYLFLRKVTQFYEILRNFS